MATGLVRWHSYAVHGDRRWIVGSSDLAPTIDGRVALQKAESELRRVLKESSLDDETIAQVRFEHEVAKDDSDLV